MLGAIIAKIKCGIALESGSQWELKELLEKCVGENIRCFD
jgi:hypothetical protein